MKLAEFKKLTEQLKPGPEHGPYSYYVSSVSDMVPKLIKVAEAAKLFKQLNDKWGETGKPVENHYYSWDLLTEALKELEE